MAHYHIRWSSGVLDWERHDTQADAEEAAKDLAPPDEKYTVEFFRDDSCQLCQRRAHKGEKPRTE